jgi:hypothetical protein
MYAYEELLKGRLGQTGYLYSRIELNSASAFFNATFTSEDFDNLKDFFWDSNLQKHYIAFRVVAYVPGSSNMDLDQDSEDLMQALFQIEFLDSTTSDACASNTIDYEGGDITYAGSVRTDDMLVY